MNDHTSFSSRAFMQSYYLQSQVLFANFHKALEGANICWVYTEMPVCFEGERGRGGGGEGVAEWVRES